MSKSNRRVRGLTKKRAQAAEAQRQEELAQEGRSRSLDKWQELQDWDDEFRGISLRNSTLVHTNGGKYFAV